MNDTLFDVPAQMAVPPGEARRVAVRAHDRLIPRARLSDPEPAQAAGRSVRKGAAELEAAVAICVRALGPCTAFDVADALGGRRWSESTVRSAVSRCEHDGRILVVGEGQSPRGRPCVTYGVRT